MRMPTEQVLCVPNELFRSVGDFQGFFPDAEPFLNEFFDLPFAQFRPRDEVETDPTFKQLIPYCLLVHEDKIFVYERGKSGGEKRLTAKLSMGIGGHINPVDQAKGDIDLTAYENAVQRELLEEVTIGSAIESRRVIGIINDDSNSVGQVHLGVVEVFYLDGEDVKPNEDAIANGRFVPLSEIAGLHSQFESWSGILSENLAQILDETIVVEED